MKNWLKHLTIHSSKTAYTQNLFLTQYRQMIRTKPIFNYDSVSWKETILHAHIISPESMTIFFYMYMLFFSFIFISWRLITLLYCSGFCHTLA